MVTHLQMKGGIEEVQSAEYQFKTLSIAIILKGQVNVQIDGFHDVTMEEMNAYYILPEQIMKITSESNQEVSIFFTSCDI